MIGCHASLLLQLPVLRQPKWKRFTDLAGTTTVRYMRNGCRSTEAVLARRLGRVCLSQGLVYTVA